ncbi:MULTISPECIES: ornithine decarboxylase [Dyella]|uniref:Ornithine decarboxylase n=2 Tax=Dyella TaxID=231454 RepID=A0A4R0Z0X5_9GAMM|nr:MULTISPECIES: ornithine decarboxylase [Dyella]TBR39374.1 ornithine decarboxylase [Dyella terrae]TCI13038.1 ornithine decarboxylase [Dyella soli]
MGIPLIHYFRILVAGERSEEVATILSEDLHFRVLVVSPAGIEEALRSGADLGALVVSRELAPTAISARDRRGLRMPIFMITERDEATFSDPFLKSLDGVVIADMESRDFYEKRLVSSVEKYVSSLMTPFFGTLMQYDFDANGTWACPGHQGGQMFMRHPVGRLFYEHMGENVFRDDICNAMVSLGDLLIHEGPALEAQQAAARVFQADRTYFVLNGTSSSNKVVNTALLTSRDIVLFDRNNHKSNHHGALVFAGAIPIYLETDRNGYGMVGPIDWSALDEASIREKIRNHPRLKGTDAWQRERPIRVAIIEQCTYDGTVYNARKVLEKIGRLCEYIHFDEAWAGFGAFHPLMKDHFAMSLSLGESDPGVIATQSTHKQLAGFSQASQIHVRDAHIRQKPFRLNHKRFNEMFMLQASTSPFYPLFSSLDVNAQMHADKAGRVLWDDMVRLGIDARKAIRKRFAGFLNPFVPDTVAYQGQRIKWEDVPTDVLASEQAYWQLDPNETWHGYRHLGRDAAMVDPTKLMLTTPGIDPRTGDYASSGIPATIIANYLRENNVIPEKNDLNSILFLMTPAVGEGKMAMLLAALERFRDHYDEDSPLEEVLPALYRKYESRYRGYSVRQIAQEMHEFYASKNVKELQRLSFRYESFPEQAMSSREANEALVAGRVDFVAMDQVKGRVAATLALIYPPGIGIVIPGERYDEHAQPMIDYFLAFQESCNRFPGFSYEVQGVYQVPEDGKVRFYTYVVRED